MHQQVSPIENPSFSGSLQNRSFVQSHPGKIARTPEKCSSTQLRSCTGRYLKGAEASVSNLLTLTDGRSAAPQGLDGLTSGGHRAFCGSSLQRDRRSVELGPERLSGKCGSRSRVKPDRAIGSTYTTARDLTRRTLGRRRSEVYTGLKKHSERDLALRLAPSQNFPYWRQQELRSPP